MGLIPTVTFLMSSSGALFILLLVKGRHDRLHHRLRELRSQGRDAQPDDTLAQFAHRVLPKLGATLVPKDEEERTVLQARLLHAGLYSRQAMALLLGVKVLLCLTPVVLAVALYVLGIVAPLLGLLVGTIWMMAGLVAPSLYLDKQKTRRQTTLRRSLPDALDVLVICMEGGLSLPAALQRVADELQTAYPLLATELHLVQRDVQLGRSPGEALRHLGNRTDLEEIRSLASVIIQADRYGAGLVKTLRVHAETLRQNRRQHAEERAQKAGLKILFPTAFFIFPAMFVVILGPAVIRIIGALATTRFGK